MSYFPNSVPFISLICHVHQLSNSKFSLCLFFFASTFSVSILPFHCLRISAPSLNTRHYLQNVVFSQFSFNSKVFFLFHLSPRLFAIRFQAASFSCCLSPWLQAWHGDALLLVGTRYYSISHPPSSSLLLPLAGNFLYC